MKYTMICADSQLYIDSLNATKFMSHKPRTYSHQKRDAKKHVKFSYILVATIDPLRIRQMEFSYYSILSQVVY